VIATGRYLGAIEIRSSQTGKVSVAAPKDLFLKRPNWPIAFEPKNKRLAMASVDGEVRAMGLEARRQNHAGARPAHTDGPRLFSRGENMLRQRGATDSNCLGCGPRTACSQNVCRQRLNRERQIFLERVVSRPGPTGINPSLPAAATYSPRGNKRGPSVWAGRGPSVVLSPCFQSHKRDFAVERSPSPVAVFWFKRDRPIRSLKKKILRAPRHWTLPSV